MSLTYNMSGLQKGYKSRIYLSKLHSSNLNGTKASSKQTRRRIYLLCPCGHIINSFISATRAESILKVNSKVIGNYARKKRLFNGVYFSYSPFLEFKQDVF